MTHAFRIPLLFSLWLAVSAASAWAGLPGALVDVAWLSAHRQEVAIIDIRAGTETFENAGHIPGAVPVDWNDIRETRIEDGVELVGMLPGGDDFAALMRRSGINNDSAVVIVSEGRNAAQVTFAARLYWQMKYYGHDRVALLDGGMAAWVQAGLPVARGPARKPAPGSFSARGTRPELLATMASVDQARTTGSAVLLDARDFGQYFGLFRSRTVAAAGHIPGARLAPVDSFLEPGPVKRFLDATSLRRAMKGLGADASAIVYCNTGHFAAGTWFALSEIAGNGRVSLYDGSMNEWTRAGMPVASFVSE